MYLIAFLPLLPAILSAIGGIGSTVASGISSAKMKRYNDPLRQLQRLNRAGLPMAAMGNNIANSQSEMPDFSGISQAGDALGSFLQNAQTQAQIELLEENLRGAQIGNDMSFLDYLVKKEDTDWSMAPAEGFMDGRTNQRNKRAMEYSILEFDRWMKQNQYDLDALEKSLIQARYESGDMDKLWQANFDNLMKRNNLMQQAFDTNEREQAASKKIMDYFEKGGMSLAEAIFLTIMQSLRGGVSKGGMNLGF